ncbi:MAG: histidine phosphatase family protein [Chloroflexota bacterium]
MNFILIRHAQSAPKASEHQNEWGLTAAGEASCLSLAKYLSTQGTSYIFCSSERKAILTAQFTADHLGIDFAIQEGLEEQNNDGVGWFESADDFKAAVQKLFEQPNKSVFGPETAEQSANRFKRALNTIAQKHADNATIAIVTHGRVMTSYLQASGALPDGAVPFWRSLTFPDCVTISWPKGAIVGRESFD